MCHSRAWIVRVLQPGDSSRQAAFCCLGPYIKGWRWAAENPVYKSKTVYSQKPVAAQGLSAFLSYIMDRNDQAKAGVTGAPGAKKRTPPFRVEFFIWRSGPSVAAGAPPRTGPGTLAQRRGLSGDGEWAKRRAGKAEGRTPRTPGAHTFVRSDRRERERLLGE